MPFNKIHHMAIICSDYKKSKSFYVDTLGLKVQNETYREERQSYKLDLTLNGDYIIELFSFPNPPQRMSRPEASGLRHLAFEVDDVAYERQILENKGVAVEPIRVDAFTQKKFAFFADPDGLPIELYEK